MRPLFWITETVLKVEGTTTEKYFQATEVLMKVVVEWMMELDRYCFTVQDITCSLLSRYSTGVNKELAVFVLKVAICEHRIHFYCKVFNDLDAGVYMHCLTCDRSTNNETKNTRDFIKIHSNCGKYVK